MKKALAVLLIFLMLPLSACASQTPALQAPTATPPPPTDTPIPTRHRRTPTPMAPSLTPSPVALRATDTPTEPITPNASSPYTISAVYVQAGGSESANGEFYTAANPDQSAVYVSHSGKLTLTNATITTSGDTSSQDNSSLHGLNAAVLAAGGSRITLSDSAITTSGAGANGAFATDAKSSITLSNVPIQTSADGAHGGMAANGGSLTLTNVDITTTGSNAAAIATGRGGGSINVTGGTFITSGQNSPDIYSTGAISVTGGTMSATGAEAAVIEGGNSITLTNTSLFSTMKKWGVMIYQSTPGDAQPAKREGAQGVFSMTGGSLSYDPTSGPLFYVTNTSAAITLNGVILSSASRTLLKASAGDWGSRGSILHGKLGLGGCLHQRRRGLHELGCDLHHDQRNHVLHGGCKPGGQQRVLRCAASAIHGQRNKATSSCSFQQLTRAYGFAAVTDGDDDACGLDLYRFGLPGHQSGYLSGIVHDGH